MCQTQHSLFNVDSFVMHLGLITGWMTLVMKVDSAKWYENLIARHCLHHVVCISVVTPGPLRVLLEVKVLAVFVSVCLDKNFQAQLKHCLPDKNASFVALM